MFYILQKLDVDVNFLGSYLLYFWKLGVDISYKVYEMVKVIYPN